MVLETEAGDADEYDQQGGEAREIADEERTARRSSMSEACPPTRESSSPRASDGTAPAAVAWLACAAVFGMNDGLVSNLSLILGVAGAGVAPGTIVLTGFAGLLAGAFSMAAGEYTSVASQRDLLARQVELEKREIAEAPEEEAAELTLISSRRDFTEQAQSRTAAEILKNPDSAADTSCEEPASIRTTSARRWAPPSRRCPVLGGRARPGPAVPPYQWDPCHRDRRLARRRAPRHRGRAARSSPARASSTPPRAWWGSRRWRPA